jgi:hypothetical protein
MGGTFRAGRHRRLHALAAVLAGNVIYFVLLSPRLPAALRHRPFAIDLGLALDLAVCGAAYALLAWLLRRPGR